MKTAAQSFGFKIRIKHIVRGAIIILNRGNDQAFLAFLACLIFFNTQTYRLLCNEHYF